MLFKIIRNQHGLGFIVEVILIAALTGIVGFIVYSIYKPHQANAPVTSNRIASSDKLEGEVDGYYYVKAYKVRFKLGPELKKQKLKISSVHDVKDEGAIPYTYVGLSTQAIQTSQCQWGLGNLVRYEGVHDDKHEADHGHSTNIYRFPGFHIILDDAHSACHASASNDLATKAHTELVGQLKTLEAIK